MFRESEKGNQNHQLVFASNTQIFIYSLNFDNIETIIRFKKPFNSYPNLFCSGEAQNYFFVASNNKAVMINMKDKSQFFLCEEIKEYKGVVWDKKDYTFIVIANRYKDQLGVFMFKICPHKADHYDFLIK